jgi:hypothetical protein
VRTSTAKIVRRYTVTLEQRLLNFQKHYQQTASPFQWTFTRKDLNALLTKLSAKALAAAA